MLDIAAIYLPDYTRPGREVAVIAKRVTTIKFICVPALPMIQKQIHCGRIDDVHSIMLADRKIRMVTGDDPVAARGSLLITEKVHLARKARITKYMNRGFTTCEYEHLSADEEAEDNAEAKEA